MTPIKVKTKTTTKIAKKANCSLKMLILSCWKCYNIY